MAGASSSHRPRVIEKRVVSLEEKVFLSRCASCDIEIK